MHIFPDHRAAAKAAPLPRAARVTCPLTARTPAAAPMPAPAFCGPHSATQRVLGGGAR